MLIDVDSGSGVVPLHAALRFGLHAVGIQPAPEVARMATEAARELGSADRVRFIAGDVLAGDLSQPTVVILNGRVKTGSGEPILRKLQQLPTHVRIVSRADNGREWKWIAGRILSGE